MQGYCRSSTASHSIEPSLLAFAAAIGVAGRGGPAHYCRSSMGSCGAVQLPRSGRPWHCAAKAGPNVSDADKAAIARDPFVFRKSLHFGMLIFATGIALFAALKYLPEESELDQKYASCAATMTSDCLGDLGFAEASRVSSFPRYVREVSQMGQIGHLAEAHALELRIQEASGLPLEAAKVAADRRFASLRITAAIRAGKTVRQAFD